MAEHEDTLGKLKVNIDSVDCGLSAVENKQRQALEQIVIIPAVAEALSKMEAPAVTHMYASFATLIDDSKLYNEAVRCYAVEVEKLSKKVQDTFGNKVMVVSYATKDDEPLDEHKRKRRAAEQKDVSEIAFDELQVANNNNSNLSYSG